MPTPTRRPAHPRPARPALLALAALALAGAALTGCSATPARPVAAGAGSTAAPAAAADATRTSAIAIGDSIAFGKGVQRDEAWPALVAADHDWRLTDLAVSGSGFVKAGWNGTTYRQQVDTALHAHPGIILIAATRNDRDQDPATVTANADAMLRELREAFPKAAIVGITGVWGADAEPASMQRVDEIVGDAVRDVGGTFLDIGLPLAGHPELVQADGIHPNAAGQKLVAKTIEEKLAPLGLAL